MGADVVDTAEAPGVAAAVDLVVVSEVAAAALVAVALLEGGRGDGTYGDFYRL
jgi:hypothetical protein